VKAVYPTPTVVKVLCFFAYSYSIRVKDVLGEVWWPGVLLAPEQGVRVEDPVLQQVPDHVTEQNAFLQKTNFVNPQNNPKLTKMKAEFKTKVIQIKA
jgi:hypothetical protein